MGFAPASNRVSREPKIESVLPSTRTETLARESRGDEQRRKRDERSERDEGLTHESSFREGF